MEQEKKNKIKKFSESVGLEVEFNEHYFSILSLDGTFACGSIRINENMFGEIMENISWYKRERFKKI